MTTLVHQIHKSRVNLLKCLDSVHFDVQPYKDVDFATIHQMCASQHAGLLHMVLHKKDRPPEGEGEGETDRETDRETDGSDSDASSSASSNERAGGRAGRQEEKNDPVANSRARVFVHYHVQSQSSTTKATTFKPNNLYELIDEYKIKHDLQTVDNLTVVIMHDVTDSMHKILSQIWENDRVFVNVFSLSQLQFCILEHTYVPKHVPLSHREKARVYETFYVKQDSDLPEISRFDPAAKAVALRPGQLCQILRPNKNSIVETHFYRMCV